MSDSATADSGTITGDTTTFLTFPSLPALHAAHLELVRRQRENGTPADFLADVSAFIQRGSATGVLLDAEADRETAQGLLDYWSTIFYRAGYEPPDATLAEFDASLAPLLDDVLCPYVGLDAFREDDLAIFFGRQRTVHDIIQLLGRHRLIAVIGPSGSGKSSVVRAGVIPALRDGALPGSEQWHAYPPLVPGATPLTSLARLLAPPNATAEWIEQQQAGLRNDPGHLAKLIDAAGQATAVLCVDQFEDGVVEALLHDLLGEPAALPLLQFTLLKLWEHRARNRVTNEAYQRLGGGRRALARSADEFYASLIPEEQVTARRILLRMIRPGEGLRSPAIAFAVGRCTAPTRRPTGSTACSIS